MSWILHLLIEAGVLLLLAYLHPGVKVRSYGTAIGVALVVGILNATIGLLLRFTMNLFTPLAAFFFCTPAGKRNCHLAYRQAILRL